MRTRLTVAAVSAALLSLLAWAPAGASTVLTPASGPNTGGTVVTVTADQQPWILPVEVRVACGDTEVLVEASAGGWGVLTFSTPDVAPYVGECALSAFSYKQPFRFDDPLGSFTFTGAGPTSPQDCRDGGWRSSPRFANEGECIRFVVANELRSARVDRLGVRFAIAYLATDTSGWYPIPPGVTHTWWSMEFSVFDSRDADGRLALANLWVQRDELWVAPIPGGSATHQQATLCARATEMTHRISGSGLAVTASGTLTLYACGTSTAIGAVPFTLHVVAIERFHSVGLLRGAGAGDHVKVNERDGTLLGSLTIDGRTVAEDLVGSLWLETWDRHTVER